MAARAASADHRSMRRTSTIVTLLALGAALASGCNSTGTRQTTGIPGTAAPLALVTYNMYLGADLTTLFSSALDASQVAGEVARIFGAVQASDPAARADAIAAQIASAAADVVALEEVALWRTQSPADGSASPATDVAYDFLALVLDGLARRGLDYTALAVQDNVDVEAAGAFATGAMDVRLTDRDALLVRAGSALAAARTSQSHFTATLVVPTVAIGVLSIPRGWIAADGDVGGRAVRVVATHLESVAAPIRDAQAAELLAGPTTESDVIVTGDFNFAPGSLPYGGFDAAALTDEWTRVAGGDPGPTCCQAPDLRNATPTLDERIDLVWTRGAISASAMRRLGAEAADRTASGLWPSDHAGVAATLDVAP